MTNEQLQALGIDAKWLQPLEDTFAKYDIEYTLESYADFLRVRIKNIEMN